jgi:trehalose/maltose transport system substrate-binding protein
LRGWERRAAASPLAPELMDEILAELDHILLLCRWAVEQESPRELEVQAAIDAFHSFVTNLYFVDEMHSAPGTRIGLSADRLISAARRHQGGAGGWAGSRGRADETDIYHLEITQLPHYADYLLDLTDYLTSAGTDERAAFLPIWIDECTVNGALVGLPYFTDIGMLFYRIDLLEKYGFSEPPATWDELEEMAATIQAGERGGPRGLSKRNFWGFVWQGKIGGSMLVNALIWQASHGGGVIVEADGTISVNNPRAAAGLQRAARWLGWISPPDSLVEHEIISMSRWYAGLAAFMHQWPGAFSYKNFVGNAEIRRVTRMVRMPSGGPAYAGAGRMGVLGGWPLTVARHARDPERAVAFVREAASYETQLRRVRENPWRFPTLTALYEEPEVLEAGPHFAEIKRLLTDGLLVRPSRVSGPHYPELARRYCATVHRILLGQTDAATALAELEQSLVALTGFRAGNSEMAK